MIKDKSNFQILIKSLRELKPFRKHFLFLLFLEIIATGLVTFSVYYLAYVVDSLTIKDFDLAFSYLLIYLSLLLIPELIQRGKIFYEMKHLTWSGPNFLERKMLSSSLDLSLGQIKSEHTGFKQDIINSGLNSITNNIFILLYDLLPGIITIIVSLIGLLLISPKFFFIGLAMVILLIFIASLINRSIRKKLKTIIELRKNKNKTFLDLLSALFFIKFSNQKTLANNTIKQRQDVFEKFAIKAWNKYHALSLIKDFVMIIFIFSVGLILFGDYKAGLLTIGIFIPVLNWFQRISNSVQSFNRVQRQVEINLANINKMFEMLDQKTDIYVSENPVAIKNLDKEIQFENVSFSYDGKQDSERALIDIDVKIKKGEKVALVGKSGSGKTTLTTLLLRLYDPQFGKILIDGNELREISLEDWHNLISYVPQDGDLIDVSIKDNILFGTHKTVSEKDLEKALKDAEAFEFVEKLPNGINTLVGERGIKLSGGQKQRICIARALIKHSQILILDEATSALDSETEESLNKNIWDLMQNKTGIVIAHRLSTILDADKIIVMNNGQIDSVGSHTELLKTSAYYKKLTSAQNISF